MQLSLLRHGATELSGAFRGSLDDPLTAQGWQQMWQGVQGLSGIEQLVSSPLQRCRLFAETLASQQLLPLTLDANWQELHFGDWEGKTAAELMRTAEADLTQFWQDPLHFTPPNAEPLTAFMQRIEAALAQLQAACKGKHVLLISHGGVMRYLLLKARGLPLSHLLQIEVPHGSLFTLDYRHALDGTEHV